MQLEYKPELAPSSESSPGALLQAKVGGGWQRSDEELVIAAQNGESSALGELLGRHQKMMFCFARRYTANSDEANDLVQETMLRACGNIQRFRGESRFLSWLSSIAINTALSKKRRDKKVRWINIDEEGCDETRFSLRSLQDVRRNPEEEYSHRELRGLLRREALKLHPKYRSILKACDFDDCSLKEVACAQGIRLGAAKSRLFRARWSLSAAMKRAGAVDTKCAQSGMLADRG